MPNVRRPCRASTVGSGIRLLASLRSGASNTLSRGIKDSEEGSSAKPGCRVQTLAFATAWGRIRTEHVSHSEPRTLVRLASQHQLPATGSPNNCRHTPGESQQSLPLYSCRSYELLWRPAPVTELQLPFCELHGDCKMTTMTPVSAHMARAQHGLRKQAIRSSKSKPTISTISVITITMFITICPEPWHKGRHNRSGGRCRVAEKTVEANLGQPQILQALGNSTAPGAHASSMPQRICLQAA